MHHISVVILEDEAATARNLRRMLGEIAEEIQVVKTLASVGDAVSWLQNNAHAYDLCFMDIRLADGLSFDVFKQVTITQPVIFVTAYHDYALTAFKNNGIDYILKPFDKEEVSAALLKYKNWIGTANQRLEKDYRALLAQLTGFSKPFKKSFLVHYRDKLIPVETAKISWFYTTHEIVLPKP